MKILFSLLGSGKSFFWLVPLDVLIVVLDSFLPLGHEKMSVLILMQLVICSCEMNFHVLHSYLEDLLKFRVMGPPF